MRRRSLGLMALVVGVTLATAMACGGGSDESEERQSAKPLAVEEYAARVCDPVDLPDGTTWKQLEDKLQADIDRAGNVIPPDKVRDYHLAALASIRETLRAIKDFDPAAMVNEYELSTDSDFVLKAAISIEAQEQVDNETAQILTKHGCNVERPE